MILLNYEKKKLFMFSVGSKLVLFGPAVKTQYAVGTCTY